MNTHIYSLMAKSPRKPIEPKVAPFDEQQTTFQVYDDKRGTIDFTEFKLIRLARTSNNIERQLAIRKLLQDYKMCQVMIAWNRGEPMFVKSTH